MNMTQQDAKTQLELIIDKMGICETLHWLADICYDKAAHVEQNWQDKRLSAKWDKTGRKIELCRHGIDKMNEKLV